VGDAGQERALISTELVGQRIMDRYRISERVARGGMSVVYRGEDERLRRPVCVKVFCGLDPSRPGYRTVHEHFVQEAFALSTLRHPNTIRIYDFGYLEDQLATPFFVVEYADGGTLKEFVRKHGPLSAHETFEILEPIAEALREAHAAGIIHRDIKPSNILFTRAGPSLVVKLADFSIAKAIEDAIPNRADDTNINNNDKVGLYSLGWAAPEQLRSESVGPSADVFALGLTTAYMLTCKMVYPGDDVLQLFELRRLGDAHLRRTIAEHGLDDELLRTIVHACRENADERFQTIEEYLEALRESVHESWRNVTSKQERYIPPRHAQPMGATQPAVPPAGPPRPPEHVRTGTEPPTSGGPTHTHVPALANAPASQSSSAIHLPSMGPNTGGPVRVLTVDSFASPEIVVGGRRIRSVSVGAEAAIGAEAGVVSTSARMRITPRDLGDVRMHIKGLNCFVVRDGSRPSIGIDIDRDVELVLMSPARELLDRVAVHLGTYDGTARTFQLHGAALAVPLRLARWSVLLDFGPGRETILLYRTAGGPS
jgi:serine/threonine-protein kinase